MKKIFLFILLGSISLYGCAAGSATAGYSLRASCADDISSKCRQSIVDEVTNKVYEKVKEGK